MLLPGKTGRMEFTFTDTTGKVWTNSFGVVFANTPDFTQVSATAEAVFAWYDAIGSSTQTTSVQLQQVRLIVNSSDEIAGPDIDYAATPDVPLYGTIAGDQEPISVCAVIKELTGIPGRSFRGRLYWAGIPVSGTLGDTIADDYAAGLEAALELLSDTFEAIDAFPAVLSFPIPGVGPVVPVATLITNYEVTEFIGTRRMRLRNPH